jgi:hypothetical protein
MRWLTKWFSASDAAAAADGDDATIINGNAAPNDGDGSRSVVGGPAARDVPDPRLPEEIKRRQVALILRYVIAIRVR